MSINENVGALILRKYGHMLSDEECKVIAENTDKRGLGAAILGLGPPFNDREADFLAATAEGDFPTEDSDDILDKYADHVLNYHYTYNNEAKKVDPGIDTQKEHIGPMAQDLEKVNPAVVQVDPKSGYKTVDTGRLALMNAGAIADLARQIKELRGGI